jgi:hypothetical protein
VTSNSELLPGEQGYDRVLGEAERQQVEHWMISSAAAAQDSLAAQGSLGTDKDAIGRGQRWSDVPRAAATACDERGVELAIVSLESSPDSIRFVLISVDNRPAELVVTRTQDAHVYKASASVGWQGEETARAERLLEAFDRAMQAYGSKRGFMDEDLPSP